MAITPTGVPAWLRTVAISHYGGHASKENYLARGAIDALTDIAAEEFVRITADLAAAVRTVPFAVITLLNNDTSPAAPTIESVFMMTGVRTTSYPGDSAPTGFPSAARNGTGDVTLTFASSYTDEYGIAGAYAPRAPKASGHGTTYVDVTASAAGQTVQVLCFDAAGVALGNKRVTLTVW